MLTWDEPVTPAAKPALQPLPPTQPGAQAAVSPATPAPAARSAAASTTSSSERRVNVADKRIINGQTDVNQLVPFKYKWAW